MVVHGDATLLKLYAESLGQGVWLRVLSFLTPFPDPRLFRPVPVPTTTGPD